MARKLIGIDVRKSERTGRTTYRVRWYDPDTGKQLSHTFIDRHEAIDAKRSIELAGNRCYCAKHAPPGAEVGSYGAKGTKPTVTWGTYAHRHIHNKPGIGEHYRAQNQGDLERHMAPLLPLPFEQVTRDVVSGWIRGLERKGLSATTVHRLVVQAGSVQRAAVDAGLAANNPFANQRTGRRDRNVHEEMHCLTHHEWAKLRAALPEGVYRDLCTVLVGTGMRFGEATALRIGSVELDAIPSRLHVNEAWKADGHGGWVLGPPKSRRSRRTITFGSAVAEALRPHVERTDRGAADLLVFLTPAGAPIRNSNFAYRIWHPAVRAAGLSGVRIHDLRHTHASWLIAEGRPTAGVSRRLGHGSLAITDTIYTHILPQAGEDDIAALNRAMPAEEDPPDS